MDKRFYEFNELYRVGMPNTDCKECKGTRIPSCINDDFCCAEPMARTGGILTMAFVDMQPLESVYPEAESFCKGSLFPNITKPFYGGKK